MPIKQSLDKPTTMYLQVDIKKKPYVCIVLYSSLCRSRKITTILGFNRSNLFLNAHKLKCLKYNSLEISHV